MVAQTDISTCHAETIGRELAWFEEVLDTRMKLYFNQECGYPAIGEVTPPEHARGNGYYADFIRTYRCTPAERLVLMLALAPHVRPQLLDVFCIKNATYDKSFCEFGGLKGVTHGGFLPTGETAVFLLAGDDLAERMEAEKLFRASHYFFTQQMLQLQEAGSNEPYLSGGLSLSPDQVSCFSSGAGRKPHFSKDFPARLIHTQMEWEDLILPEETLAQIEEIRTWIQYHPVLMNDWGFGKKLKPGYKCLFYGPPGTGKTLVACLLGKRCGMDVYRIDLSMLVSKYIGETEKNLEKIFQQAENKNWILFFDEADALFGKRSGVNDSHDRYANQETAYLLQRLEDFNGIVILATNLKSNIDEAFARRFQSMIYFPVPKAKDRIRIWERSFSPRTVLEEAIDLEQLARRHDLTGGMIMNVIRYCSLMALQRNENVIRLHDAEIGIQKELVKEGRMLS
ncbi:MAG TPA: ATP-binding protein [Puia sp.]|jgi:DNA polymerase III delta prime subunit|nr:ATP-binding protein [Puia sp.]